MRFLTPYIGFDVQYFSLQMSDGHHQEICSTEICSTDSTVWAMISYPYTAKNATDLLKVVNFIGLLQLVNQLQQACQFHQVATSLLRSSLLQLVICRLVTTC